MERWKLATYFSPWHKAIPAALPAPWLPFAGKYLPPNSCRNLAVFFLGLPPATPCHFFLCSPFVRRCTPFAQRLFFAVNGVDLPLTSRALWRRPHAATLTIQASQASIIAAALQEGASRRCNGRGSPRLPSFRCRCPFRLPALILVMPPALRGTIQAPRVQREKRCSA